MTKHPTSQLSLDALFDSTAISSLTLDAGIGRAPTPVETDDPPEFQPPSTLSVPAKNWRLQDQRGLAATWKGRAVDNLIAIRLLRQIEGEGRGGDPRGTGSAGKVHRLRCFGTGAELFRRPGEDVSRRLAGDRYRSRSRRHAGGMAGARARHAVCPLHAGDDHPRPLARRRATGLCRRPRAGTRHGHRPVLRAAAREALREDLPAHRHRIRPDHRPHRRLVHPGSAGAVRGLCAKPTGRALRPRDRQSAIRDRVVRADTRHARPWAATARLLHRRSSIARLRPGGIALFVTSTGTMDKASATAREHIAGMADLVGAVRLPEGSMRASAGTEVVIDLLVFQRRRDGEAPAGAAWIDLASVENAAADDDTDDTESVSSAAIQVNRYFAEHPGDGAGRARDAARHLRPCPGLHLPSAQGRPALETLLTEALDRLPCRIVTASARSPRATPIPTTKPRIRRRHCRRRRHDQGRSHT